MDERDPGADTAMFRAYAQRENDPTTASVRAVEAQQRRGQMIKMAIVAVIVLVAVGVVVALMA
jgi:hypothetical protein